MSGTVGHGNSVLQMRDLTGVDLWDIAGQDDEEYVDNAGRDAYLVLREQVTMALERARLGHRGEVNFSNQPHEVITEVLRAFANPTASGDSGLTCIDVVYADGSRGRPFPLACLAGRDGEEPAVYADIPPLRAALLSMRHLALDHEVDMAWFRNREVSKTRAFGETDEFCYQRSLRLLRESRASGPLVLHIYQTGLQPAVIGLYRAVVEEILARQGTALHLQIVPFYYRKSGPYVRGKAWW
jgi:hypothetical protein